MALETGRRPVADRNLDWDPERATVHDVVGRVSGSRAVFDRFGIDTCCGGELPVALAARRHGVDVDLLLDALEVTRREAEA